MFLKTFPRKCAGQITINIVLLILLGLMIAISLGVGQLKLSFGQIFEALWCQSEDFTRQILLNIRLPRILLGALVGAGLAVSGTILQGVMRNVLASPDIIGISAGGGVTGIAIMLLLPQFQHLLIPGAFVGSLASALLVYMLAWKRGASPIRLILSGVAVAGMLGALSSTILLFNSEKAGNVLDYTIGTLSAGSWSQIKQIWPYLTVGLISAIVMAGKLNILALGDEVALGLGIKVESTRLKLLAIAALLASACVCVAGLLGFVGLIAPHIMRIILGGNNRHLLVDAALFGAIMVVGCDTVGRMVIAPAELPVGVIMSLLGPPFFLWLLRRHSYEA